MTPLWRAGQTMKWYIVNWHLQGLKCLWLKEYTHAKACYSFIRHGHYFSGECWSNILLAYLQFIGECNLQLLTEKRWRKKHRQQPQSADACPNMDWGNGCPTFCGLTQWFLKSAPWLMPLVWHEADIITPTIISTIPSTMRPRLFLHLSKWHIAKIKCPICVNKPKSPQRICSLNSSIKSPMEPIR